MHVKPVALSPRTRQRGQALAFIGIAMIFLTGMAVVGIDVGRLAFTAAEVQSIADATATAGAGALAKHSLTPLADAKSVAQANYVDGRYETASTGSGAAAEVIKSITPGIWDFKAPAGTDPFTASAASAWADPNTNAVRAVGVAHVTNLMAAAIGFLTSDVERHSTAAAGGACTEIGAFPVAIEKDAIQSFLDSPDCSTIPPTLLFQVPTDNSCFTSLSTQQASKDTEVAHIPTACSDNNGHTGGGETAQLNIGDSISLQKGQTNAVLQTINACLNASPRLDEFVVPVVPDGACDSTSAKVDSFARIKIDRVDATGSPKGVWITAVCREELTGTNPGCLTAGENAVAIVK